VPNEWRISCRPSSRPPHKPTFHSSLNEGLPERNVAHVRPVGCMRGLGVSPVGVPRVLSQERRPLFQVVAVLGILIGP